MKRAKDPDVRREELIDIAEELFLQNGYEETPVSDIVKKAQVAQGTFYYYFKSKDEILDAIADRYHKEFAASLEEVASRDMNAVDKIISLFKSASGFSLGRGKLIDYLHQEKNALFHLKMEQKGFSLIVPIFSKIIEQGIKEGLFDTEYPHEAALLILACQDSIFDIEHFREKTVEERKRTVKAGFYMIERILGIKTGSLTEPFLKMEQIYKEM
ncbi:MAG: TetR/AcrR family transcriptional regulator [Theionarchaea archaeon]|nr:TetR/AcrR family transcriptional regulator [Theionarchaea archaeon]